MASSKFARLREQTMGSLEDEEAVTVNTRALIDKVLARYSGEWTTLRELIQNAADAQARNVTIRFETLPSPNIPLPTNQDPNEHLKHVLLHHTLKTLLVTNDGAVFQENDWQRLKRIAEGNPDETKIGAFGVGFYSVFADCETPFVSSGNQTMAFYWKRDSLFTRRGKLDDQQPGTTFLLDYRNQTTPIPPLLSLCQFLATSLTFVGLDTINLQLDDLDIIRLTKKMSPGISAAIGKEINPKTRDGLMQITDVTYQNAQIDARWMNVVGWNRTTLSSGRDKEPESQSASSGAPSLRSWFTRFTGGTTANSVASKRLQREEEVLQQAIVEDLVGSSTATVFLRLSTVKIRTNISRQLSAELERATKKPPPKTTKIAILTASCDEAAATMAATSGAGAKKAGDIFASVLPTKSGKIFIGFPTAQTTGVLAHISAPSVIPTVERENIDLNARYVRDWNVEMLRVAGIACRIAFSGETLDLKTKLERSLIKNGNEKITKDDISNVLPSAIHLYKQYNFEESTPSHKVGQFVEEGFWTCNQKDAVDVLSTRGVLPTSKVRVATEDLSFVDGIPVIPSELMAQSNAFLTKLRDFGILLDITTADIKKELEAQALTERQIVELLKWACAKVSKGDLDAGAIRLLFDGTVGSVAEEHVSSSLTPVIQLGEISSYVNTSRFPSEMPMPPETIPFRLTRNLPLHQLAGLGWEEQQIVPWLRWLVETDGRAFGPSQSLTGTPAVAVQVLPVISKAWDGLSQSSKQTVAELLTPRTVIPTKLGLRRPVQAYFGSVKLFDDLPTITGLQGVKEKFLGALGVRKTVELTVVFDRLMAKTSGSSEEGKWSHVDLIKYLVGVKDDIPQEDLKRLRNTPMCSAESSTNSGSRRLYKLAELYEPQDQIRKLGLPILQWPHPYRASSPEGRFLKALGLQPYPSVPDLVDILTKAPANSELQSHALTYFIMNYFPNGYDKFPLEQVDKAFIPVQPFAGEANNLVAKPAQCFANPQASVLRFRTLRQDLQQHHAMFGVALDPPIEKCAERLIKSPPADILSAKTLFGYMAGRMNEIGPNGNLAEKLGEALIVPIVQRRQGEKSAPVRFVTPRSVFLGNNQTYTDIFDFVDFDQEANSFLLRIGSKHEPSAPELAATLVHEPARLLDTLGTERYLHLLRKLAESAASLKKQKQLWQHLKQAPCLLAVKEIMNNKPDKLVDIDDDELYVKEYSLAAAANMVIVDDFGTYSLFQANLLTAPQEEMLEGLYQSLETPLLSHLVENNQRLGALLRDQSAATKLHKLLVERCRLFLHDHTADVVRHDAKWLEQNLIIKSTEFIKVTKRLKGNRRLEYVSDQSAYLHRENKKDAVLYITPQYDLYEVSRAVMSLLLKRPRQQDYLALETILESDLRKLKTKGYNVDRILRLKAAESRIAESERFKREEEQKRLAETRAAEAELKLPETTRTGTTETEIDGMPTPDKTLTMPGAFGSPDPKPEKSKKTGFLSNIKQQFGLESSNTASQPTRNLLTNANQDEPPPPYDTGREVNGGRMPGLGTELVTSSRDVESNLRSAINSARAYNSSSVFNRPETKDIKETPSYCDSKPGHDLTFIADLISGVKFFLPRTKRDPNAFMTSNQEKLASFASILLECAQIYDLSPQSLNIFHDETGASIAFNTNGSIFCNFRYFLQLHAPQLGNTEGKVEAIAYWYVTLAHEIAHNLVSVHDSRHSFYTESLVSHYFRRMMWLAGRVRSNA